MWNCCQSFFLHSEEADDSCINSSVQIRPDSGLVRPIIFIILNGVRLSPLGTAATTGLFIIPPPDDRWWWLWNSLWNEDWQGKPKYSKKTYPSTTLSTTQSQITGPALEPGRRGGKPATNRLNYGVAFSSILGCILFWLQWRLCVS
jgi:hypothetical protein